MDITSYLLGKKAGGGGTGTLQTKQVEVTSNGSQNITADSGYDGLNKVELTTNVQPDLESKSITITENTTTTITPSQDKDGLSSVSVITNVPQGITPTGTINITQNGTVDVTNYASADVNVSGGGASEYFYDTGGLTYKSKIGGLLKKIPSFTWSGTSASEMFNGIKATSINLTGCDFSSTTSADYMFANSDIGSVTGLDTLLTNNISNMSYMFNSANLAAFDFSKINTSKCTNMTYMFEGSKGVTSLNLTSNNFNTSKVTNVSYIFGGYSNSTITDLNISTWDLGKVKTVGVFASMPSLVNLSFGYDLGKAFTSNTVVQFSSCNNLSHDSLMSIINNLYDMTTNTSIHASRLVLGDTNLAKLSTAEKQVATDKGWVLS